MLCSLLLSGCHLLLTASGSKRGSSLSHTFSQAENGDSDGLGNVSHISGMGWVWECVTARGTATWSGTDTGSAHSVHALNHWDMIQSASIDLLRLESNLVYSFFWENCVVAKHPNFQAGRLLSRSSFLCLKKYFVQILSSGATSWLRAVRKGKRQESS